MPGIYRAAAAAVDSTVTSLVQFFAAIGYEDEWKSWPGEVFLRMKSPVPVVRIERLNKGACVRGHRI
jgi:hypothetical protein